MLSLGVFVAFVVGLISGAVLMWWRSRDSVALVQERLKMLQESSEKMETTFKALSTDALQNNAKLFIELAQGQFEKFHGLAQKDLDQKQGAISELLKPMRESLERVDVKIHELDRSRAKTDEAISQQVKFLLEAQNELRNETGRLVTALRAPQARGRWGEIQLKRVVEMAGMLEHCDFVTQESAATEEGRLRPDLIVKLPAGKNIVVDSKVPLLAFLDSLGLQDPKLKSDKLTEHARYVRKHIEQLGRKSYWDQFRPAPEFVVLFLPGENFFAAALEADPSLIEFGVSQNVIVATPTTLISLLRSVAYGWRQENLAANARLVGDMGRELYKRLADLSGHFFKLGRNLEASVDAYNKTLGTLESRVLVTARKFKDLDAAQTAGELSALAAIDQSPRALQAPELINPKDP